MHQSPVYLNTIHVNSLKMEINKKKAVGTGLIESLLIQVVTYLKNQSG